MTLTPLDRKVIEAAEGMAPYWTPLSVPKLAEAVGVSVHQLYEVRRRLKAARLWPWEDAAGVRQEDAREIPTPGEIEAGMKRERDNRDKLVRCGLVPMAAPYRVYKHPKLPNRRAM